MAIIDVLPIDELHAMHFGVYNFFVAATFWHALQADMFEGGATTKEERVALGVARLR